MSEPSTHDGLILVGGGGHALVVAEAADLAGFDIAGFLDDRPDCPLASEQPSAERLGTLGELARLEDAPWILAIGDLDRRRVILDRVVDFARPPVSVVHPTAFLSPSADLGLGVYVGPGAVVHARATIGDSAIINSAAVVEHDTTIGPNTHVAPGAILGGTTTVGRDTLVGLGSRVLPNTSIGDRCTIGAGAVVTRNISNDATVVGVPAGEMKRSPT